LVIYISIESVHIHQWDFILLAGKLRDGHYHCLLLQTSSILLTVFIASYFSYSIYSFVFILW